MLKSIQSFFNVHIDTVNNGAHDEHSLQLATAALMFEIARADNVMQVDERVELEQLLQQVFSLSAGETRELADLAEQEVEGSISLYQFTSLINKEFSLDEKIRMIEMLWQVAYTDGNLDRYEEAMVRKIAELIYVEHQDFMKAKHRVLAQIVN